MERKFNKQPKLHVRKGDTVKILSGNDKGKEGKIMEILIDKNRAIVEGINIITKHQKPSAGKPEGGIKKTEGTIHLSNLMLIEPGTGKAVRTGRKLDSKGKLQRYSKKTGEFIKQ
ncbi:MAG: 50S ribosomal protein L24 [Chryseotalea sp. WA131a]|jgi:large subunit ribosomal protein L24|nr:MAG: 50S ribosomal protein L24 [Chryseotalea sp. WA131a]